MAWASLRRGTAGERFRRMIDAPAIRPPRGYGLIWGWHPDSDAPLDEAAVDALLRRHPEGGGLWLHLDLTDTRARPFLQSLATHAPRALPPFAVEALLERAEAPHLELREGVLSGAVPDFHHDDGAEPDPQRMGLLTVALTPALLITARRHPMRATHHRGIVAMPGAGPAARWDSILREVLAGVGRCGAGIAAQLNRIEEELLRGEDDRRAELSGLRRAALLLHRRIEPLALAYEELAEAPGGWLEAAGHAPALMERRLRMALRVTQGLQDRGRIAQDELASLVAGEANRRLLVLSILTALLLPPSLIAGIFGMNTTDLPGTEAAGGFWWALGAILASAVLALGLMLGLGILGRRRR